MKGRGGPGSESSRGTCTSIRILNRVVSVAGKGCALEADSRRVELRAHCQTRSASTQGAKSDLPSGDVSGWQDSRVSKFRSETAAEFLGSSDHCEALPKTSSVKSSHGSGPLLTSGSMYIYIYISISGDEGCVPLTGSTWFAAKKRS